MKQDRFLEFNEVVQRHHFPPPNRKRTKPISKQIWTEEAEKVVESSLPTYAYAYLYTDYTDVVRGGRNRPLI